MFEATGAVAGLIIAEQQGYGTTGKVACAAGGALAGKLVKWAVSGTAGILALKGAAAAEKLATTGN